MGRPLYTTALLARYATDTTHAQPPKPTHPFVEKWSRWNAFDPDSDEFFDSDSAVYEAFLSEEEIAERAQAQQRESARLLADTLLREAEADTSSASSSITADSDRPAIRDERVGASRSSTVQMDIDIQYAPRIEDTPGNNRVASDNAMQDNDTTRDQPSRRQPRRSHAVFEWPTRETTSASTDVNLPQISVVPVEPVDAARTLSRSVSPGPLNLVSGLNHLSESPRPLVPTESQDRAVSPIPNTPARLSGVFTTPQSARTMVGTPSPAPATTPRILSWGSETRGQWLPDSPTPAQRVVFNYMESRLSAVPPLAYWA